ncbi:hypothetical protein AFB00_16745 [Pseudonocardia sp. HH130630-07]|nr:hypothetical protein AFB00_16745 [Pseudonocardia sp. HH130630-07]
MAGAAPIGPTGPSGGALRPVVGRVRAGSRGAVIGFPPRGPGSRCSVPVGPAGTCPDATGVPARAVRYPIGEGGADACPDLARTS